MCKNEVVICSGAEGCKSEWLICSEIVKWRLGGKLSCQGA